MGAGPSKEEQLYQAVQNGNHHLVKSLRRDGASLEWIDKEGRTPLILASTRGELFDMVVTLLNLGANLNAYRPGANGGFPLHHAAKRGLEKTVILLISRGADPLAINDDGETPLSMARMRGHPSVVRIIEDRICLFSGMVREVSGPGLLEVLIPQWLTKKVWVVVLPVESRPTRAPRHELVIYQSPKMAEPRTTVSLWKAELEEPKWSTAAPALVITDKSTKSRYKLLSEMDGDLTQLDRLYKACIGIPPENFAVGYPIPQPQPPTETPEDDVALAMAINASLQAGAPSVAPPAAEWAEPAGEESYNGWGPPQKQEGSTENKPGPAKGDYGGWEGSSSGYNGWDAGPSNAPPPQEEVATSTTNPSTLASQETSASAPPLPSDYDVGPIHYPSVDTSPVSVEVPTSSSGPKAEGGGDKAGTCVVCWDSPAQCVCIPCGHLAGCMDCLQEIKKKKWGCPVCRAPIEQVVKVYAV